MTVNLFTNLSWYLQFSSIRPFISFLVAGILTALSCNICSPEMSSGAATAAAKINCNCASLPYQCSWHQSRSCPRLLAHLVISDTRRLLIFSRECQWLEVCCLCCLEIRQPQSPINTRLSAMSPAQLGEVCPGSALTLQNKGKSQRMLPGKGRWTNVLFFPAGGRKAGGCPTSHFLPLSREGSFLQNLGQIGRDQSST